LRGARTFLVKVKAHRGEPLNESAVTTWTKAVRKAMVRGGAEFHRQKAYLEGRSGKSVGAV
jgi:hypothetical protein